MEDYLQTEWPDLQVWLTSTTEQWAVIAVQGPNARSVLTPLVQDIDLATLLAAHERRPRAASPASPALLFRVSFTGELGYEINVPADHGAARVGSALQRRRRVRHHALRHRGDARAARREGLHHRRPGDRRHGDAGRRSGSTGRSARQAGLRRQALARAPGHACAPDRKQLVGLLPTTRDSCSRKARRSSPTRRAEPMPMLGHVTSSYCSPNRPLDRDGAGRGGRARIGETVYATTPGGFLAAKIAPLPFLNEKSRALVAAAARTTGPGGLRAGYPGEPRVEKRPTLGSPPGSGRMVAGRARR